MKKIYVGLFVLFCCLNVGPTLLAANPSNVTSKSISVTDLPDRKNIKFIVIDGAMKYPELRNAIKTAYGKDPKTIYITSPSYTQPSVIDDQRWLDNERYHLNYDKDAELFVEF